MTIQELQNWIKYTQKRYRSHVKEKSELEVWSSNLFLLPLLTLTFLFSTGKRDLRHVPRIKHLCLQIRLILWTKSFFFTMGVLIVFSNLQSWVTDGLRKNSDCPCPIVCIHSKCSVFTNFQFQFGILWTTLCLQKCVSPFLTTVDVNLIVNSPYSSMRAWICDNYNLQIYWWRCGAAVEAAQPRQ